MCLFRLQTDFIFFLMAFEIENFNSIMMWTLRLTVMRHKYIREWPSSCQNLVMSQNEYRERRWWRQSNIKCRRCWYIRYCLQDGRIKPLLLNHFPRKTRAQLLKRNHPIGEKWVTMIKSLSFHHCTFQTFPLWLVIKSQTWPSRHGEGERGAKRVT